jgi:hypothetical protein
MFAVCRIRVKIPRATVERNRMRLHTPGEETAGVVVRLNEHDIAILGEYLPGAFEKVIFEEMEAGGSVDKNEKWDST